jgi:hypothetical protein
MGIAPLRRYYEAVRAIRAIEVGEDTIGGIGLSNVPNGGPHEEACGKSRHW